MLWYPIIIAAVVLLSVALNMSGALRFDTTLHWTAWIAGGLVLLNAGWMAFDGGRALVVGDFVTPQSGEYAGQLGPWASALSAVGIDPRSTMVKLIFLSYGIAFLVAAAGFLNGIASAWWAMLILAVAGLWYLPFGTLANIIIIGLLLSPTMRTTVENT